MGIPMLKLRQSQDCLIFNLPILILVRWYLYIETVPWGLFQYKNLMSSAQKSPLWKYDGLTIVLSLWWKSYTWDGNLYCSGSLEPESSCHDRDWIMELPMEADILTFTGILTPGDASVASSFPFDITISLSWFPLLSIPPLHSAIP